MTKTKTKDTARDEVQVSNGAEELIAGAEPYMVDVTICGDAPLLYHAWNTESVEEKANAAKGSKTKKTDDLESYVYRTEKGYLGIAGKCFKGAIKEAARFVQDPRSPRKSLRDLAGAAIHVLTPVAALEPPRKNWDYEDRQRVTIQRSAITRTRPALNSGWVVTYRLQVTLPTYIPPALLHDLIIKAGQFSGLGDFRPSYGRFRVTRFSVAKLD